MKKFTKLLAMLALLAAPLFAQQSITSTGCSNPVTTEDKATVLITVSGSWSGAIQVSGVDAAGSSVNVGVAPTTTGTVQATITANGGFLVSAAGFTQVKACGATITGTASVLLTASQRTASNRGTGAAGGGVSSVALALPAGLFTVSGSPVTTTGTLTGSFASIAAHTVLGNNTSGAATAAIVQLGFSDLTGSVTAAQLPNPAAGALGGVRSLAAVSSQWINSIGTDGQATQTQPAFTDISGSVAAAQLPNPSSSTLGGVRSLAAVSHLWVNTISVSGIPAATQPAVADLSDTPAVGQFLAGPSAYGASAAVGTMRVVNVNDIPGGYGQCATLDYAICQSSVDASGNPNEITAGTGGAVTVAGGSLVLFIQGKYQTGTGTYTNVVTGTTSSFNYLYVKQDVAAANLAAADFAKTVLPPVYSYKTPTACTSATSTDPQYWFDLGSRQWKVSTAAACSFSVASPQVIFLGVFWVTATPTVSGIAHEPFNLSPYRRFELFGDGFDALAGGTDIVKQGLTSGTTVIDNFHSYTAFEMTGATVTPTAFAASGATQGLLVVYSQNPILIINSSNINANALGRAGGAAGAAAGAAGNAGGLGGAGGGGGGASATNAGAAGAGRPSITAFSAGSGGGTAGANTGGNGGTATSTPTLFTPLISYLDLGGSSAGSGGGDGGASSGGAGGAGAGAIVLRAPSIVEDASSTMAANGGTGGNGGGTNGGAGGGGGGGFVVCHAGFCAIAGTDTASAGTGGTKAGGGGNGGNGTAGIVQNWRIF